MPVYDWYVASVGGYTKQKVQVCMCLCCRFRHAAVRSMMGGPRKPVVQVQPKQAKFAEVVDSARKKPQTMSTEGGHSSVGC